MCTILACCRQRQGRRGRQRLSGLQGLTLTLWRLASSSRHNCPSQACHRRQLWRRTLGRQGWAPLTQAALPVPGAQPPPTTRACSSSSSSSSRCSQRNFARPAVAVGWSLTGASVLRTGMSVARCCPRAATALQRGLLAVQPQQRHRWQGLRRHRSLMWLLSGHRVSADVCMLGDGRHPRRPYISAVKHKHCCTANLLHPVHIGSVCYHACAAWHCRGHCSHPPQAGTEGGHGVASRLWRNLC